MFKKTVEKPTDGLRYGDILDRFILLEKVQGLKGDKLCFARRKNLMKLRAFEKMNSMENRIPETEAFKKYQAELSELRGKFLLTDKEGKTVMRDIPRPGGHTEAMPLVDVANPSFTKAALELKEKYKDAITEREDDLKAYREFLNEIVPGEEVPEIHFVKLSDVSGIDQEQADAIAWFIEE
jgi:hypothetical protein